MAAFDGLLGGGGGDPLDIYGDLFTPQQRAALRDREMGQGLLRLSAALAKAAEPSPVKRGIGSIIGAAAGAFGAGGDEAANKQLEAMSIAEKVRGAKSQRNFQEKYFDPLMLEWMRRRQAGLPAPPGGGAPGGGGGAAPGASRYPGAVPPPAPPALTPNPDMGDAPAKPLAPFGASDTGDPLPAPAEAAGLPPLLPIPPAPPGGRITPADYGVVLPKQSGLLGPGNYGGGGDLPEPGVFAQLAQLQQRGGGAPGGLPFDPTAPGPDGLERRVDVRPLSGTAAPAGAAPPSEDDRLSQLMKVESLPKPAVPAHLNYGATGALGNPAEAGWRNTNIVPVTAPGGASFNVHRAAAPDFTGFLQDLSGLGYKINPQTSSSYNYRNIRGSNQLSEHAYGTAIDVNSNANLYTRDGRKVTDLPPEVGALAAKHNLEWGGNWKDPVDTMHFQWRGPGAATSAAAAPAEDSLQRLSQLMQVERGATPGDPRGMTPTIRAAAQRYGVDPDVALRVAQSEGLNRFSGDGGKSGSAFQLYTGGGLGNEFQKETGLDPLDPKNEAAAVDWAMKNVSRTGWSPYHGAAGAGIGDRTGLPGETALAQATSGERRVNVRPLSGEAVPAGSPGGGGAPASGQIPGLGINPEDLAMMNMLAKRSGLGEPFNSLLETYYKSPAYLMQAEAAKQLGGLPFEGPKAAAIAAAQQKYIQENQANQSNLDIAKELLTKGGLVQMPDGSYKQITSIQEGLAAVENAKNTGDIKEYNFYKKQQLEAGQIPETFDKWDQSRRKASATTINTAEGLAAAEQKARIDLDKEVAGEAAKKALAARQLMPLLDEALVIARKTPESMAGAASVKMAQVASLFGIAPTPGQSNAELLQSINQRLIPMVREPGATAALEMDRYLAAGPGLMLTADGRVKIAEMTKALGQRAIEIARVYRENMGKPDLYDKLAQFDRPLFTDEQRAAMDAAMSGKPATAGSTPVPGGGATAPLPPPVGTVRDGYRFKGGAAGDPGNWERAP